MVATASTKAARACTAPTPSTTNLAPPRIHVNWKSYPAGLNYC